MSTRTHVQPAHFQVGSRGVKHVFATPGSFVVPPLQLLREREYMTTRASQTGDRPFVAADYEELLSKGVGVNPTMSDGGASGTQRPATFLGFPSISSSAFLPVLFLPLSHHVCDDYCHVFALQSNRVDLEGRV